ncbi:MAG: NCS2 family permease, partial [Clostridia bacterium]|nr:NCS2 family permease [Clostridia bacterium]
TAFTAGMCFLACMFLSPIAALVPAPATSAALIYVGVLMLSGLKNVNFDDVSQVLPTALMLIAMPVTGSIGHGIGLAIIAYTVTALLTGKKSEISGLTYVLALMFVCKFFLVV